MTVIDAFTVPIFTYNNVEVIKNLDLKKYNHQQTFDLHQDKNFTELVNFKKESAKDCLSEMGYSTDYEIDITTMWINIMKPHSHTNEMIPHSHDNQFLSCVFYTEKINSPIVFQRPWITQFSPTKIDNTGYNANSYFIQPEEGDLIIFPSYLLHQALINVHMYDRISIASNVVLRGNYGNHEGTRVKL